MNKYRIITFLLLVIVLYFSNIVLAQPYYFERGKLIDSTPKINLYEIDRINLSNGITNIFLYEGYEDLAFDQTQTWVANGWNDFNYIYNYLDTTNYFSIDSFNDDMLFSQNKNIIYIFCWDSSGIEKQLVAYDVIKKQKKVFLNLPSNSDLRNTAFFSSDENTIYFTIKDSAVDNNHVAYYSTNNNQIIQEQELSLFGYPNADGYKLHKGRQGKGIVQSFIKNKTKDSYYKIYNFDNNTSSNFILHQGLAEPFITQDSNYLLLAEQGLDTLFGNTAKFYYTGVLKIYNVGNNTLIKTLKFPAHGTFFMSDNYPSNIYYIGPINNRFITNINIDSVVQPSRLLIKFVDSHGMNIINGSLQYYDSTWKDAINNNDGTFLVNTTLKKIKLKMTYNYGTETLSNVPVGSDTVVFRTINTTVQLKDSHGNPIDTGTVQYYAGAWRGFGTTTNGVVKNELLPNSYKFKITYAYASSDTVQNIGTNPNVVFQTVNAAVQLKNSSGALMDTGTVQYYSGGWRNFGTTTNGAANMELLPNNYKFRMIYKYVSKDTTQNIGESNIVNFSTVLCTISVKDSLGQPLNNADTKYYAGGWREIGLTSGGITTIELLPVSLSFRAKYGKTQIDAKQDLSAGSTVSFILP